MRTKFLKPNNPLLRKVSRDIPVDKINSKEVQDTIKLMLKVVNAEQKDSKKPVMVGLAAPQIGISKRIILVDVRANGKGKVGKIKAYINPEIIWKSKREGKWYEGCFSIPGVCGIVQRSKSIKIQGFTITPQGCNREIKKYSGYIARIFQHEIDHLNGVFFINHITNPDHLHKVLPSEFPNYRNNMAWKNWPKKHPLPLAYELIKQV